MRNIIFILLACYTTTSFAQEVDSMQLQRIQMIQQMMYMNYNKIFKPQQFYSKVDDNFVLPWLNETYSTTQLNNALNTLAKNASLELKKAGTANALVEFSSSFPDGINNVSDIFDITIQSSQIKNNNDITMELRDRGTPNFGSKSTVVREGGKNISTNTITVNKRFPFKSRQTVNSLKGDITLNASFIHKYNHIVLTKSDIGNTLQLGELKFKVIDIIDNKAILHFEQDMKDIKLFFVNVNDEQKRIAPISFFELAERRKKDSSIPQNLMPPSEGQHSIDKTNYEFFVAKPTATFEEFQQVAEPALIELFSAKDKSQIQQTKYTVFVSADHIENFYLYMPLEPLTKEIKLTVK